MADMQIIAAVETGKEDLLDTYTVGEVFVQVDNPEDFWVGQVVSAGTTNGGRRDLTVSAVGVQGIYLAPQHHTASHELKEAG